MTDTTVAPWMHIWRQWISQPPFSEQIQPQAAALIDQLLEVLQNGDSCLPCTDQQAQGLNQLMAHANEERIAPFVFDGQALYLQRYWSLEMTLASHIVRLQQQAVQQVCLNAYQKVFQDNPEQQQALNQVLQNAFTLITGGPGTGKTYTLARIVAILSHEQADTRIALAAPTGKAAQRMQEALQNAFAADNLPVAISDDLKHVKPMTLHRLLGLGLQKKPRFDAQHPLPYDVIVVDEASMLDLELANMLFAAIPTDARLILLGDANQLASVDVGAVLADLQQVPQLQMQRIHLQQTRRFKSDSGIKRMADFIQQPLQPTANVLDDFAQQVVQPSQIQPVDLTDQATDLLQLQYLQGNVEPKHYDQLMLGFLPYIDALKAYLNSGQREQQLDAVLQAFDEYRILTAMRHGALGLNQVNRQVEQRLFNELKGILPRQAEWYVGRPVMMTYNDYQIGLSNGDIGICLQREADADFEVYFPSLQQWFPATRLPRNIETAFALTIHKSQGSEFRHTAVVFDDQAERLLSKELLYTAITRAKTVVSLLVTAPSLQQALVRRTARQSGLSGKIEALFHVNKNNTNTVL